MSWIGSRNSKSGDGYGDGSGPDGSPLPRLCNWIFIGKGANQMTPDKENSALDKFYTPQDIADSLRVKGRVVLNLLRSGKLRGVKVGKQWRVKASDLEAFIEQGGAG